MTAPVRRTLRMVLVVVAVLAIGRTLRAEGWCMFPTRAGSTLYTIDPKTGKAREIVKLRLEPLGRPAVGKGVYYVGEPDNLVALDAATGKPLWGARTGYGQIVLTEETLYTGGYVRALNPKTGEERWKAESSCGSCEIVLAGDLLICGLADRDDRNPRVCALDRKSGKERWQFSLKGNAEPIAWLTLSRASEELVFVARSREGHLLSLKNGQEVASFQAPWPPRPESTLSYPHHLICTNQTVIRIKPPADRKERGSLEAIDATTRKTRWQTPLPCAIDWDTNLLSAGDLIFLVRKDDLYVFQANTGELRWQAQEVRAPVQVEVAKEAGTVYLLDSEARLQALKQKTGKQRWRIDLVPKDPSARYLSSHMTLTGGTLYLVGNEYVDPRWGRVDKRPEKPPLPR